MWTQRHWVTCLRFWLYEHELWRWGNGAWIIVDKFLLLNQVDKGRWVTEVQCNGIHHCLEKRPTSSDLLKKHWAHPSCFLPALLSLTPTRISVASPALDMPQVLGFLALRPSQDTCLLISQVQAIPANSEPLVGWCSWEDPQAYEREWLKPAYPEARWCCGQEHGLWARLCLGMTALVLWLTNSLILGKSFKPLWPQFLQL